MHDDLLLPLRIDPEGIYLNGQARLLLGLNSRSLARARREGRLRYTQQGRSIFYRGRWLLEWLDAEADRQEVQP